MPKQPIPPEWARRLKEQHDKWIEGLDESSRRRLEERRKELEELKPKWEAENKRTVANKRAFIERELLLCVTYTPQFDPAALDDLAMSVLFFPDALADIKSQWPHLVAARALAKSLKPTITAVKERWRETSADMEQKLAATQWEIAHYERFFGKGDRPAKLWAFAVRSLGPKVLAILQAADKAAGRKPRKGYGDPDTSPVLQLILKLIEPVCERCGETVPETPTLRDILLDRKRDR
jgi:hypothetical protein